MPQLPQQFLDSIKNAPGLQLDAFMQTHATANKVTSVRLNPFKPTTLPFAIEAPVPWLDSAFYLKERPVFTLDPLFHAGCYYVQEAGSMFLAQAFSQVAKNQRIATVLDVCAAPGGKSTLLSSLIGEDDLLVCNEVIKNRSLTLASNLSKWGRKNAIVINQDVSKLTTALPLFDFVVVDAPCSGSGLFRKQPEAVDEWHEGIEIACSVRQKEILRTIVPSLKEDAHLFYSTCSYAVQENEDIVNWLLNEYDLEYVPITLNADWHIFDSGLGYRFYPDQTQSEGFFCALLKKKSGEEFSYPKKTKANLQSISLEEASIVKQVITNEIEPIIKKNNFLYQFSSPVKQFVEHFEKQFYFRKAGTCIGEIKGRDLIPDHELALSCAISVNLESCELTLDDAIKYLRKDALSSFSARKGFVKITYGGYGIGWAKLLNNRVNNYLPNEARILMQG